MAFYVTDKDGNEQLIAGAGRVGPRGLPGPPGPKGDTGDDGNPIGTVISFLGLTAPEGYLVCDGTAYSMADYPALSAFIAAQFGSANHFGGDGTATFAVPDMRNLFLRGYHGTAEEQLSGDVGARQEATKIPSIGSYTDPNDQSNTSGTISSNLSLPYDPQNIVSTNPEFQDKTYDPQNIAYLLRPGSNSGPYTAQEAWYGKYFTTRPINMAILYCIKAVKTVSSAPPPTAADVSYDHTQSGLSATTVQGAVDEVAGKLAAGEVYSTEEVRIGTWIDGRPLYRRRIQTTHTQTTDGKTYVIEFCNDPTIEIVSATGNMRVPTNQNISYQLPFAEQFANNPSNPGKVYSVSIIFNGGGCWSNCTMYIGTIVFTIFVEYTKTTDAPETA